MSNSKDSRIDVCFSETGLREGTVVAELDAKGDIMLTTSVRTAESTIEDETSLDTSFMDIQEIESIREQDAFMYHSIVQQQRRSNTVNRQGNCGDSPESNHIRFDEFNPRSSGNSVPRDILEILDDIDLEDAKEDDDMVPQDVQTPTVIHTGNGEGFETTPSASDQQQSTQGRMPRRRSRSLMPSRATPQQRRFTQSFAGFATGVVTRKRRVTTECHHSLVLPDPEMIRSIMSSSLPGMSLLENMNEDNEDDADDDITAFFDSANF